MKNKKIIEFLSLLYNIYLKKLNFYYKKLTLINKESYAQIIYL